MKVLVAYGSRYGSTEGIAVKITEDLEKEGFEVKLINLRKEKHDLYQNEYDGVIVGSSIKIGKWTKETKNFLKENKEYYNETKVKGLFVSCLESYVPENLETANEKYIENIISELGLEVDLYNAFGGILDLSKILQKEHFREKSAENYNSKG